MCHDTSGALGEPAPTLVPSGLRILGCSQSGNHPENNLTTFGYILGMKVEKNRILLYLATYWNLS